MGAGESSCARGVSGPVWVTGAAWGAWSHEWWIDWRDILERGAVRRSRAWLCRVCCRVCCAALRRVPDVLQRPQQGESPQPKSATVSHSTMHAACRQWCMHLQCVGRRLHFCLAFLFGTGLVQLVPTLVGAN